MRITPVDMDSRTPGEIFPEEIFPEEVFPEEVFSLVVISIPEPTTGDIVPLVSVSHPEAVEEIVSSADTREKYEARSIIIDRAIMIKFILEKECNIELFE